MGWMKGILNKLAPKRRRYADMQSGYAPIFSQFGKDIYASDVVRQAIDCIVKEVSKLEPCFIRQRGNDYQTPDNDRRCIQNVLDNPNHFMTKTDFLSKIAWQLYLNDNAFAVPVYELKKQTDGSEYKQYRAIYPVTPMEVTFLEDARGKLYVQFRFENGYETTLPYEDVIHIRNNFSVNDFMGGDESGNPDNRALLETLQLNKDLLTGVSAGVKTSFAINGVVKTQTVYSEEKERKAIEEFEKKLNESKNGILHLDGKSDYTKISRDVKLVDPDTLKFIDEKILRNFGVPLPILTGDYTKAQYEAFYQKTIEVLVERISEAFTRVLCTSRMRSEGNKIMFFTHELIFMSIDQKIEMVKCLGDAGTLYENEKRVAFGYRPSKELEGIRKQSLNYIDTDIAVNYQLKKAKGETSEE